MPRKRSQVKEDSSKLQQIEAGVVGTRYEPPIRMLRLLEEDPERTITEVAAMLDRPDRTVRRWWRLYLDEGVDALLETAPVGGRRPSKLDTAALEAFYRQAQQTGFAELKDARQWLVQEFGVDYSISRVSELLKAARDPRNRVVVKAEPSYQPPTERVDLSHLDLVEVLNSLPTSADLVEWRAQFSQMMTRLAPDIDRISVNVDTQVQFGVDVATKRRLRLIQYVPREKGVEGAVTCVSCDSNFFKDPPSKQLIEDFKKQGHPVDIYHVPTAFDYVTEWGDYLGSLIVWRKRENEPTSQATLALIEELRPFIVLLLSDVAARYQCRYPADANFHDTLGVMRSEINLTKQEHRVITLRLLGYSYREIAEMLSVSVATIKKHLSSVHDKAQTRSHAELFARYFSSRKWT